VRRIQYRGTVQVFRLKAEAYKKNRNNSADNNGWEKGTAKYAEGNREKLSDRIYRIVQDLFFFRKALMKNM